MIKKGTKWFFDKCNEYGVEYDVIGQSFYPWWHGSLDDLRKNLDFMANEYHKDIYVVEAAYNWRPAEYRNKPGPFSESPEGQKKFLEAVNQACRRRRNTAGRAFSGGEPAVGMAAWQAAACSTMITTRYR